MSAIGGEHEDRCAVARDGNGVAKREIRRRSLEFGRLVPEGARANIHVRDSLTVGRLPHVSDNDRLAVARYGHAPSEAVLATTGSQCLPDLPGGARAHEHVHGGDAVFVRRRLGPDDDHPAVRRDGGALPEARRAVGRSQRLGASPPRSRADKNGCCSSARTPIALGDAVPDNDNSTIGGDGDSPARMDAELLPLHVRRDLRPLGGSRADTSDEQQYRDDESSVLLSRAQRDRMRRRRLPLAQR